MDKLSPCPFCTSALHPRSGGADPAAMPGVDRVCMRTSKLILFHLFIANLMLLPLCEAIAPVPIPSILYYLVHKPRVGFTVRVAGLRSLGLQFQPRQSH